MITVGFFQIVMIVEIRLMVTKTPHTVELEDEDVENVAGGIY